MNSPIIHVDGGVNGGRWSGIAAIATQGNRFLGWHSQQLPLMTNMEAEYRAALLGVQLAQQLTLTQFTLISDSQVLVRQVQGRIRILSPRLKPLHRQLSLALGDFRQVQIEHVLREKNRFADALASDAVEGRTVSFVQPPRTWRPFLSRPKTGVESSS